LGRLVKYNLIKSLEEIYTHSIPIKESQIVDELLQKSKKELSDEVMKIISVQKQTKAGQRTRFKAVVACGDMDGHVGLGVKAAKEVQIAIKGALVAAKLSLVPVRRGYWGNKIGNVHTVPIKVMGKCGSVRVRLIPAPRGTGIVGAPTSKKLLQFAGVEDCFTSTTGSTKTLENFVKATFDALSNTYGFLTPDLWPKTDFLPSPFIRHADQLEQFGERKRAERGDRGDRPRGRGGRGGRGGDRGDRGDRRGGRGFGGRGRGGDRGDRGERHTAGEPTEGGEAQTQE
jgi:small subunit ribosomal protein S2e